MNDWASGGKRPETVRLPPFSAVLSVLFQRRGFRAASLFESGRTSVMPINMSLTSRSFNATSIVLAARCIAHPERGH
jgi:hypothetical protein